MIRDEMKLTQKTLKELLHYDPDTGIFTWKERDVKYFAHCKKPGVASKIWNTNFSKTVAGYKYTRKHYKTYYEKITITINGSQKAYSSHRLAFLYMTGKWPKHQIDHIDQDGENNTWINLRDITGKENQRNKTLQKNNTSGFNGVHWVKKTKRWRVMLYLNNKQIYGGTFINKEDAIEKRKQMNIEYGFHENHGKKNL